MVTSIDAQGRAWPTAVEVELTSKTQARLSEILRLLTEYDDVVDFARPAPAGVV